MDNLLAGVSSEKTATISTGLLKFMTLLCEHMLKRFPEGEVQDWVAFDCGALKSPSYAFGTTQIEALCSRYQSILPKRRVVIEQ